MWADESIFYHIYPLGFVGAEERNDFFSGKCLFLYTERYIEGVKNDLEGPN